jgi:hypothetical protein
MFAANPFQKYNIHHSGLAISRKTKYIYLLRWLPALSGGQKEGPKRLLRAFTIHSPK